MEAKKRKLLYVELKEKMLLDYANQPYYSPLPGERKLCEIYGVSRPTVRKALEIMEQEGCIARIPDKGVFFIGSSRPDKKDDQVVRATNISFYNQARLDNKRTVSKVLTQRIEAADETVANKLKIEVGTPVFHLERLRYVDSQLWTISDAYIAQHTCPELIKHDYTEQSLHNILSGYGHVPVWANRKITASEATEYEAENLELEIGAPLCIAKTVSYDANDYPLEYSINRESFSQMSIDLVIRNNPNADEKEQYRNLI